MPDSKLHASIADADAIVFDFDFTLADSSAGIIACVNYALAEMGLHRAPDGEIIQTVGLYLPEALVALKGERFRHRGEEFLAHFTRKADEVMLNGTFLLPGASDALKALRRAGRRLAIVSTKYRYRIERFMLDEGLFDTLELIIGGEDVTEHKPAPEGLLAAARRLRLPPNRCVYVGDSVVDARAAQSAEMPFVAVTSGATPAKTFAAYPRRATLSGVVELIGRRAASSL